MDMLARPRDSSTVTPVSVNRPFLLVVDELEDEESSECEVVRDFRAGAAASLFGSKGAADVEEGAGCSTVLLPRCEPAALSRLTVRDKEDISHTHVMSTSVPKTSAPICQTRWCVLAGDSIPSLRRRPSTGNHISYSFHSNLNMGLLCVGCL